MAEFSERLKQLRDAQGVSQLELAEYLNVNKQTISGYERGVRRPAGMGAREIYEKIADYFNVDISYLMGLSDVSIKISDPCADASNKNDNIANKSDSILALQPPKALDITVTEGENKMLEKYRRLSPHHKEMISEMINDYEHIDNAKSIRGQMTLINFDTDESNK